MIVFQLKRFILKVLKLSESISSQDLQIVERTVHFGLIEIISKENILILMIGFNQKGAQHPSNCNTHEKTPTIPRQRIASRRIHSNQNLQHSRTTYKNLSMLVAISKAIQ